MKVQSMIRIIAACLFILQIGHARAAHPEHAISFTLERQWPLVRVKIDGLPATLILDTGGGSALALRPNWPLFAADKSPELSRLKFGTDQEVKLLPSVWKKSPVPSGIDGYLGYGFFKNYNIVIDYSKSEFRLYRAGEGHGECASKQESISRLGSLEYLKLDLDGKSLALGLDTGANQNILKALPDQLSSGSAPARLGKTTVGDRELDLGNFRRVNLQIPVIDGFLGYDFFATHRVCMDPVARTIAIDPFSQLK